MPNSTQFPAQPAIVAYLVQHLDRYSAHWYNQGFPHPDKDSATERLTDLRETYPDRVFRLAQLTTATEIIA